MGGWAIFFFFGQNRVVFNNDDLHPGMHYYDTSHIKERTIHIQIILNRCLYPVDSMQLLDRGLPNADDANDLSSKYFLQLGKWIMRINDQDLVKLTHMDSWDPLGSDRPIEVLQVHSSGPHWLLMSLSDGLSFRWALSGLHRKFAWLFSVVCSDKRESYSWAC